MGAYLGHCGSFISTSDSQLCLYMAKINKTGNTAVLLDKVLK